MEGGWERSVLLHVAFELSDETAQSLPDADCTPPAEGVPAIVASSRSVVLERHTRGSTDAADPGAGLLDPEVTALVVDLRFEPPGGLLGIPRKCETGKVVAFVQDILRLPEERADFRGVQVVRLGFLEDRFAGGEDRLGLFDLRLSELDRPFNLLLLAFHREPFP